MDFLKKFDFITVTNLGNDPANNHWLGQRTKAFLVDLNIQFHKKTTPTEEPDEHSTVISDRLPENDRIVQIATTSFRHSRFLNDPHLPADKAQFIYADIARNAFRQAGRFFVISSRAKTVAGFLLFRMHAPEASATIELIATDPNHKGYGVGRALLRSMEAYVGQRGVQTIKVGTQLDNLGALRFYTSYGFRFSECNSIYHYWPHQH